MPGRRVGGNDAEKRDFAGGNAENHPNSALDGKNADMMPPDWEFFMDFVLRLVALGIVVISLHNLLKILIGQSHF